MEAHRHGTELPQSHGSGCPADPGILRNVLFLPVRCGARGWKQRREERRHQVIETNQKEGKLMSTDSMRYMIDDGLFERLRS
jgi:hypothetical protein